MAAVALLGCVPIVIWNAQHDWVTVKHVARLAGDLAGEKAAVGRGPAVGGAADRRVGGQAALLMGYWFIVWGAAAIAWNPVRRQDAGNALPVVDVGAGVRAVPRLQPQDRRRRANWPVTAYLSGCVLAAAWLAGQFDSPRAWYRLCRRLRGGSWPGAWR